MPRCAIIRSLGDEKKVFNVIVIRFSSVAVVTAIYWVSFSCTRTLLDSCGTFKL